MAFTPNLSMLDELKARHIHIGECMAEVGQITDQLIPDIRMLAPARVRLSKASSERARFIATNVYPALKERADTVLLDQLALLSLEFLKEREASSEHVVRWDAKSIEADWAGYRAASLRIRAMMKERIEREVAVLYGRLAAYHGA